MKMLRNIVGVVIGYLIFAISAVLMFSITGIDPHADGSLGTMVIVILFGSAFAFVGGYVCRVIGLGRTMIGNAFLAFIMAAFAIFSLFKSEGSHYTQIAAIALFAPISILGGYFRRRGET